MISIRPEDAGSAEERTATRAVNELAFLGPDEADLVDKLHEGEFALVSLVAVLEEQIVGHILFSRMWIETLSALVPRSHWRRWPSCLSTSGRESAAH